jgi:hypothetical protein
LKTLAAMTQAASNEEVRFYLCGVSVEIDEGGITYVSTDGHILLACRETLPKDQPRNETIGSWIIPTAECTAVKLKKHDTGIANITANDHKLTIEANGSSRTFQAIDGSFPDWRRIVPRDCNSLRHDPTKSGEIIEVDQFDPALLTKLAKFYSIMTNKKQAIPVLHHHDVEKSACAVSFPAIDKCEAFGVIMPYSSDDNVSFTTPTWAEMIDKKDESQAA